MLFGSASRAEVGPGSDIELLVVLDDDVPREALHWRRAHETRKGTMAAEVHEALTDLRAVQAAVAGVLVVAGP